MDMKESVFLMICVFETIVTSIFGQMPPLDFCQATVSGFGNDALYTDPNAQDESTRVDFTIQTLGYPDLYFNESSCVCTLTTTEDQDRFTIESHFTAYRPTTKGCRSMLYIEFNGEGFSACTSADHPLGYTTRVLLRSGDAIKFYLALQERHEVMARVHVTGMIGEYTYLKCVRERVTLPDKACSCKPEPPKYYISHPQESYNWRVALGFIGMIVFLLLVAAAVITWYCIRRRRRRKQADKLQLTPQKNSQESIPSSIARNSAFFADPDMPKNAHGIYAEINFGPGLPFSPDPNLRLEMRRSVDSGLYSEMSERPNGNVNNIDPIIDHYASCNDVLGPDEKYEGPASQSSPKQSPKSPEELEELYAKPQKRSKKKKKDKNKPQPSLERQDSENVIYQHPPIPRRSWNVPPSLHIQPNFNPDPSSQGHVSLRSRSGSTGSSGGAQFRGHADLGHGIIQSSRSSLNEMYATDSRSTVNLNVSRGTMETDI